MQGTHERFAGSGTALGGFLAAAEAVGLDTLLLAVAAADAGGAIRHELLDTVRTRIFSELRGWKVDAVYLAFPGATPILGPDDGRNPQDESVPPGLTADRDSTRYAEAELVHSVRTRLGPGVPIAVTADEVTPPAVAGAWQAAGVAV